MVKLSPTVKRAVILPSVIIFLLVVTKCGTEYNTGLEHLDVGDTVSIRIAGLDKFEDGQDMVRLTVEAGSRAVSGSSQDGTALAKQPLILSETGPTVSEAEEKMHAFSPGDIFWGSLDNIIIGENAAKDGLYKYIDMLIREHQISLATRVFVARGASAEEMIKTGNTPSSSLFDKLEQQAIHSIDTSFSSEVDTGMLAKMLSSETGAAYIPFLQLVQKGYYQSRYPVFDVSLNGYAFFKDGVLKGYMDPPLSIGFSFIIHEFNFSVITVKDSLGSDVSFEPVQSDTIILPYLSAEGRISIKVKLKLLCNVSQQEGRESIFNKAELTFLEAALDEKLKSYIESAISFLKSIRTDAAGFADAFDRSYPDQWEGLESRWDDIFAGLDVSVEVDSTIEKTYDIQDPAWTREGR
ncbi:MAG: Ger(x)C family spore germination protein [Bacillota bacterium]|nr:Ger(x)C family spore germination protein [Bacillota bacterium]